MNAIRWMQSAMHVMSYQPIFLRKNGCLMNLRFVRFHCG
jgi:hypothetical protein